MLKTYINTGISSSPYNAQYGAGKSYILKLTEAVACEAAKTNVDVEVITLGTTITPSLLKNPPGGPAGEAVMKSALTPEECVNEAFENLGKTFSVIAGGIIRKMYKTGKLIIQLMSI